MSSDYPAKSQPLHNFALPPLLRWKKDEKSGGSQKRRRLTKSPSKQRPDAGSSSPPCYSPIYDYVTPTSAPPSPESPPIGGDSVEEPTVREGVKQLAIDAELERLSFLREEALRYSRGGDYSPELLAWRKGKGAANEHHRNQLKRSASVFSALTKSNSETKCKATEGGDNAGIKKKPNVPMKIPLKNRKDEEEKTEIKEERGGIDEEERVRKTTNKSDDDFQLWNLRPRNVKSKLDKAKIGGEKGEASGKKKALPSSGKEGKEGEEKKEKCGKLEDKQKGEKKEKKKLSIYINLTKEEIEEDIYALTGSKPSRRPKRRTKNVQKQLDSAFPGLWLVSITAESYKVSESSLKG